MSYRLMVCIDVEASSMEEAYEKVYTQMAKLPPAAFGWESTDEAFGPNGEEFDPDDLQDARVAALERLEKADL